MWWECVWETGGDRKSPPLSSRRPSQITWVDLIAAVTQGDDNTHSGPDPPENTLLLRIIRLYCICSAAAVWTTKWARWDSGWTDRLRICPDYAVIGSQADRHGGNPAEGNTSRGGRQRDSNQRQEGISVSRLVRSTSFLTNRETPAMLRLCNKHLVLSNIWVFNDKFTKSYLSSAANIPI